MLLQGLFSRLNLLVHQTHPQQVKHLQPRLKSELTDEQCELVFPYVLKALAVGAVIGMAIALTYTTLYYRYFSQLQ
jgi:uncharacterized protein (DUF2062 family)